MVKPERNSLKVKKTLGTAYHGTDLKNIKKFSVKAFRFRCWALSDDDCVQRDSHVYQKFRAI